MNCLLTRQMSESGYSMQSGYYFYDLNLKLNHKFSDRDRLFFSFYSGDDKVYADMDTDMDYSDDPNDQMNIKGDMDVDWKWGNRVAALRWNHVIRPNLFMNLTGA